MHGKNKVRGFEGDGNRLQVHEVWRTIQGEGPFFGQPAWFVRLTGCNLRCHFCDTEWNDEKDRYRTPESIIQEIVAMELKQMGTVTNLIVLTGGEPCRQNLSHFIALTKNAGYQVQIETAGTYWQECLAEENVVLVCSPKTKHVHSKIQEHCNHWKYVVRMNEPLQEDGLPGRPTQIMNPDILDEDLLKDDASVLEAMEKFGNIFDEYTQIWGKYGPPARPDRLGHDDLTVWLSPCDEGDQEKNVMNMKLVGKLCMEFGYRAQVQLHKLLQLP